MCNGLNGSSTPCQLFLKQMSLSNVFPLSLHVASGKTCKIQGVCTQNSVVGSCLEQAEYYNTLVGDVRQEFVNYLFIFIKVKKI